MPWTEEKLRALAPNMCHTTPREIGAKGETMRSFEEFVKIASKACIAYDEATPGKRLCSSFTAIERYLDPKDNNVTESQVTTACVAIGSTKKELLNDLATGQRMIANAKVATMTVALRLGVKVITELYNGMCVAEYVAYQVLADIKYGNISEEEVEEDS